MDRSLEKQFEARDERQAAVERAAVVVLASRSGKQLGYADFVYRKVGLEGSLTMLATLHPHGLELVYNPPDKAGWAELVFANPAAYLELRHILKKAWRWEAPLRVRMYAGELAPEDIERLQAPYLKAGYRPKPKPMEPQPEADRPPAFAEVIETAEERQASREFGRMKHYLERARDHWERYKQLKSQ